MYIPQLYCFFLTFTWLARTYINNFMLRCPTLTFRYYNSGLCCLLGSFLIRDSVYELADVTDDVVWWLLMMSANNTSNICPIHIHWFLSTLQPSNQLSKPWYLKVSVGQRNIKLVIYVRAPCSQVMLKNQYNWGMFMPTCN